MDLAAPRFMSRQARAVKLSQRLNTRLRASAAAASSGIVTSGLVIHLDAGDAASYPGSGTAWTDLSGNGNNGTFTATPSIAGGIITLNGTYQVTTTNLINNPTAFSLEIWFRTNSASGRKLIGLENSQTGAASVWDRMLYVNTSGQLIWGVFAGSQNTTNLGAVNDNAWRQVITTYDNGTTLHLFNATQVASNSATASNFNGWWRIFGNTIAGWPNSNDGGFIGDGSIVRIYNRALSASEITQNFNANKARFGL